MKNRVQSGVAIVEFALVLPVLLVLAMLIVELGRALYQYNSTVKVVRDAVRYLSTQTPGTHQIEARNLIVYGNIAGTGRPLDSMLTASNVAAPVWQPYGSAPLINIVTVRVTNYKFSPMVASMFGANFAMITFSDITASMRSPI